MKIGLFIPCYIDAIYPEVGVATLELLEKLGLDVGYPSEQTCCGQPMSNEGDFKSSEGAEKLFVRNFSDYDYIVGPAGSCVKQVRVHYDKLEQTPEVKHGVKFPYKVALHNSCSSIRGLGIASPSEIPGPRFNKSADLLNMVEGVEIVELSRPDECCGFGGTFCVTDEAVSARMGKDKVADYVAHGAQYVVSPDMSCLMHQQGIALREGITHIPFIHIAQVLNGGPFKDR